MNFGSGMLLDLISSYDGGLTVEIVIAILLNEVKHQLQEVWFGS